MRQWTTMAVMALAVAGGVMGGMAEATPRCGKVCADDIRACVALAKANHTCARLKLAEATQCRRARKAARHLCRGLRAECAAGRPVCSAQ